MSSHHIVREHQEPTLIIWNGLNSLPSETLEGLLEWSPMIIVNGPMLEPAIRRGIKLDVVLGTHSEFENWNEELEQQQPLETFFMKRDDAEIHFLVEILKTKGIKQANVIIDDPEKAELFLPNQIEFVFYAQNHRGIIISPEANFQKWLTPGQYFFTAIEDMLIIEPPVSRNQDQAVKNRNTYTTQISGMHSFFNHSPNPVILWQEFK
ncbi:MAG: hypothetical protein JJU28_06760 [Cyclobacteriaceae bacterium]|nr:hypothetical protein [Cyclobacteriaceae bacterium]